MFSLFLRFVGLVVVLLVVGVTRVEAHAELDHAEPKASSVVTASPATVTMWMTEKLDPPYCKMKVFDAFGNQVDKKDTHADGMTIRVSLPTLAPGIYQVKWKAVSDDEHTTTGEFEFTVK